VKEDEQLRSALLRKHRESVETQARFFEVHADAVVRCARALAAAFDAGGRLFTFGNGGSACDAMHVAVEFMHPIFEKRPAIAAQAIGLDPVLMSAIGNDQDFALAFARPLEQHARRGDVALGLSTSGQSANVNRALRAARGLGMITVGFTGRDGGPMLAECDHAFVVPSFSIHRIQETHAALLHVLWDLIHVIRGEEDVL
jgi:D-sedoheptulose 7-phosphate isomerase